MARGSVSASPAAPPECSQNGVLRCFYHEFGCFAHPELAPDTSGSPGGLCGALGQLWEALAELWEAFGDHTWKPRASFSRKQRPLPGMTMAST